MEEPALRTDSLLHQGVSNPRLKQAVEQVRLYLLDPRVILLDERSWSEGFSALFDALAAGLEPQPRAAFEIAVDTLLVDAGLPTWTVSQAIRGLGRERAAA